MPHSEGAEARCLHNLLTADQIIRVCTSDGRNSTCSLPQLYALLMADEVVCLAALRPHQKQALHCFLVQTAAMALLASGEGEPPHEPERWAQLLRGLTPGMERDEPWCLVVEDLAKPAFMQPPLPEATWAPLKQLESTPDALDMLVTSKNHDLKAARIEDARPDHWLFALITLQTCEGYFGRGNYGISRMNGGYASRPFVGASPAEGGWGAHVRRDIRTLVTDRNRVLENDTLHAPEDGLKLLWLVPWDGREALQPSRLDPYYVEICRRVRLRQEAGSIIAMRGSSNGTRIIQPKIKHGGKEHLLPTGDPWTPVEIAGTKPLTVDGSGFSYQRIVNLLDEEKFARAPLQQLDERERSAAMQLVFIATVRGEGETQGYHERRILIPPRAVPFFMRDTASGMEGARIKRLYELTARQYGVPWRGRRYDRDNPNAADIPNQAINHAASAVEAAAAIAVASTATVPQIGFLHEDSGQSFVLDIADLVRHDVMLPIAFSAAKQAMKSPSEGLERLVRMRAAETFNREQVVARLIDYIKALIGVPEPPGTTATPPLPSVEPSDDVPPKTPA